MKYCYICGDLERDPEYSGIAMYYGEDVLERCILWEDKELFIIPAPGTLTPGYLILATKLHINCFAQFDSQEFEKIGHILNRVKLAGNNLGLPSYVMFEHGGTSPMNKGAACIDHAHLHLVPSPRPNELRLVLLRHFEEVQYDNICDLSKHKESPYILLSTDTRIFVYQATDAPSQLLRRVLAHQWGVPDCWNWRFFPFRENFIATLEMFTDKNLGIDS